MKWLIVFKKENHSKAMSLLETLGCSVLKPIADLDKDNKVVSVEGPENLVHLVDQLTKLVESSKDIIEIWRDSKISTTKTSNNVNLGEEFISFETDQIPKNQH